MVTYKRKTKDRWDIETNFGYGWEAESSYYEFKGAAADYLEYLKYAQHYGGAARIVKRRERYENNQC